MVCRGVLSGPVNQLNRILSLRYPPDRDRTPSKVGSARVWRYLALSPIHVQVGSLDRLILIRSGGSLAR